MATKLSRSARAFRWAYCLFRDGGPGAAEFNMSPTPRQGTGDSLALSLSAGARPAAGRVALTHGGAADRTLTILVLSDGEPQLARSSGERLEAPLNPALSQRCCPPHCRFADEMEVKVLDDLHDAEPRHSLLFDGRQPPDCGIAGQKGIGKLGRQGSCEVPTCQPGPARSKS